jgi:hypothetical protein
MLEVPAKDVSGKEIGGAMTVRAQHNVVVARQAIGVNDQGRLDRGVQSFFEYCEHAAEVNFLRIVSIGRFFLLWTRALCKPIEK